MSKTETKARDADLQDQIERAIRTQQRRLTAPEVSANTLTGDERLELVKRYAPECAAPATPAGRPVDSKGNEWKPGRKRKQAEGHAFFAPANKLRLYMDRGYVPKLTPDGDLVKDVHGDVLTTIPTRLHQASLRQSTLESEARIKDLSEVAKQTTNGIDEGTTVTTQKVSAADLPGASTTETEGNS